MNLIEKLQKMPIKRFEFDYEGYAKDKQEGYRKVRSLAVDKTSQKHYEKLIDCSERGVTCLNYYSVKNNGRMVSNSGKYSANKKNLAFSNVVYLRSSIVDDLLRLDQALRPFGLRIFVMSGYRSASAQKMAIERIASQKRSPNAKPVSELFSNPEVYSPHQSGGAVDVEIWDRKKQRLLKTKLSNRERIELFYLEERKFLSLEEEEVKRNRRLLHNLLVSEEVLGEDHFIHHPSEYWHYGRNERLAAFFAGKIEHPVYYDILHLD